MSRYVDCKASMRTFSNITDTVVHMHTLEGWRFKLIYFSELVEIRTKSYLHQEEVMFSVLKLLFITLTSSFTYYLSLRLNLESLSVAYW